MREIWRERGREGERDMERERGSEREREVMAGGEIGVMACLYVCNFCYCTVINVQHQTTFS